MGNQVYRQPIEGPELTMMPWCRPYHGTLRGVRVLDRQQLGRARSAVEHAAAGRREHLHLDDMAGRPLDLESLLLLEVDVGT